MKEVIVLLAIIWLSGCATGVIVTGPEKEFQAAEISVKEKKYKEAVSAYKKIMAETPDSALAADALFELSLVYVNQFNPQRDFAHAIQSFEEFIRRYPDNRRADEARSWSSVLRSVQELKKNNEHLNESIEQLKRLDIRHEEKRRK